MTKEEIIDKACNRLEGWESEKDIIEDAINEYAKQAVIKELISLIEDVSTQAYWPAIIKHRIKSLQESK